MSSISQHLPDLSSSLIPNRGEQGNLRSTQFANASFQENKSTDITLVTAEGDKVTFSSFSSLDVGHSIYTSQGLMDGFSTRTEIESFYLSETFGVEISVEGDLNEQELKDIREAFKTIEKLANDFFSGKTDHVMERAAKIAGLESISSFEAVIQYERSASVQQATTQETASPAAKSPEQESLGSLVDKMTEAILKTNVALEKAAKHSNKFLDQLFDKFEKLSDTKPLDLLRFRKIQSDFLNKLLEENESEDKSSLEETSTTEAAEQTPTTEPLG